jgi:hypothetical protein
VIGVGGSIVSRDGDGNSRQLRGFAVIDLLDLYAGGAESERTLANIKATTTHELGHLMGLGHVDTSADGAGLNTTFDDALDADARDDIIEDQLMFPALNPSNEPNFDDGDLQGLFELYGNRPCAASGSLGGEDERDVGIDGTDWTDVTVVKSDDNF